MSNQEDEKELNTMTLDKDKCARIPDDIKEIFDEIAIELADALRNIKPIERGTTKTETKKFAFRSADAIRRAGEMCSTCGITAARHLKSADSN